MVEQYQWYSLLSIVTSSVAVGLALLVWRRHPGRRAAGTFVTAMVFFLFAAIAGYQIKYGFVELEFGPTLVWSTRVFYFVHMLAVGYTAAFVGAYFYGFQVFRKRSVSTFLYFSLGAAAVLVAALVGESPAGIPNTTNARLALAAISTTYGVLMLATIGRTLSRTKDPVVRRQALVMLGGILVHGVSAEAYAYLRILNPRELALPFLTASALFMAATFAVAVLRYRMFEVTPRPEEPGHVPRKFPIQPGRAYLAREGGDLAPRALSEAARLGTPALVVTRRPPRAVREDFDLQTTPLLWLTETAGQNHVPPTDPGLLVRLVDEFVDRAENPLVLLEGIDFLTAHAGAEATARLVRTVRDRVTERDGTFLVSASPPTIDALGPDMEREFEPLPVPVEPAVDDVYVIHASGLLVTRAARVAKPETDRDVMAGMLTAIMNFVRYSFSEGSEELRRLGLGERTVAIERGERLILAVVFRGPEPPTLREEMRAFLARGEKRYASALERWGGSLDEVPGLQAMTWRLLA